MLALRIALLAAAAVTTGAITEGLDLRLYDVMEKCSFPGSFVDDGWDNELLFTSTLPINVPTWEDAQGAFKAVQADIDSPLFWARWDDDEINFQVNGSSFVIVDPGSTHYIKDFAYDEVNHCAKYSFSMESDEFPEGVRLLGDWIDILNANSSSTKFIDFFGCFNCRFDGDTPGLNQTEYCQHFGTMWSNTDLDKDICVMEHWNDGKHEQCRDIGGSRMWD